MELDKITGLFGELETKIGFVEEINARFGKTLALNFNSLDFWDIDENKVSEILAFFLDPLERHHQGAYFNETGQSVSDQTVRKFDCRAIA